MYKEKPAPTTLVSGRKLNIVSRPCKRCRRDILDPLVDGIQLGAERRKTGVTLAEIAKKMKVGITTLWMIETRQRVCTERRAKRYLMALDAIAAERKAGR